MTENLARIRTESIAREAIRMLPGDDAPVELARLEELVVAAAKLLDVIEKPNGEPSYLSLAAAALELARYQIRTWGTPPEPPISLVGSPSGSEALPRNWVHDGHVWSPRGYYKRYRTWLELKRPPGKLAALDSVTDKIIGHLGNPLWSEKAWNRRGVVVGQVQSGKTEAYIGMVAKAIDAGYKSIVVLAGLHNDLRAQTQLRVDEGIVGNTMLDNEQFQRIKIGVGELPDHQRRVEQEIISMTSGRTDGDFSYQVAQRFTSAALTHIYVIKKNVPTLVKMVDHFRKNSEATSEPILIIDDECDQASINVGPDESPTATNREIRNLLSLFPRSSFVGFTATPMANIFMHPDASNPDQGADLFPKDFIIRLRPSAEYLGPERLFGIDADPNDGQAGELVQLVIGTDDWSDWITPLAKGKGQSFEPGPLPESLLQALSDFVIGAAIKRLRLGTPGELGYDPEVGPHATMLVHVTSRVEVQKKIRDQIDEERKRIADDLIGGSNRPDSWSRRIEHAYRRMVETRTPLEASLDSAQAHWAIGQEFDFKTVLGMVRAMIAELEVSEVNGTVEDGLQYRTSLHRFVVAVGGNKLSRGLTLEGLTVSYFLRSAGTWDTLMQMGRWFGYRPRYLDLCRVYMPSDLILTYENVTRAIDDLNAQFDAMAASGDSPAEFGLRLVRIPTGQLPTRKGAMRNARVVVEAHHSGTLLEKLLVPMSGSAFDRVHDALQQLWTACGSTNSLAVLGNDMAKSGINGFRGVSADTIVEFIEAAGLPITLLEEPTGDLCDYIRAQVEKGSLVDWTVAFVGLNDNPDQRPTYSLGDLALVPSMRATHPKQGVGLPQRRIKNLSSLSDEALDLTVDEYQSAVERAAGAMRPLRRADLRAGRDPRRALLLCYPVVEQKPGPESTVAITWAISFPEVPGEIRTEYFVTPSEVLRKAGIEEAMEGTNG